MNVFSKLVVGILLVASQVSGRECKGRRLPQKDGFREFCIDIAYNCESFYWRSVYSDTAHQCKFYEASQTCGEGDRCTDKKPGAIELE